MRARYLVLNILVTVFFLCLPQEKTYAWFHSDGNCEDCPVFKSLRGAKDVSITYGFLPNTPETAPKIHLYKTFSKNSFLASAGELKIDIPFNLLSVSVTNVQAQLDRQIAANLRLKNLLEQYLALQKKNAEILKDLNIPYLESRKKTVPASDTKELAPADELKRKMTGVILFQTSGKDRLPIQDSHDFQTILAGKKGFGNSVPNPKKYGRLSSKEDYSKNSKKTGTYYETYGRNTELPWFFSFGLKLLRYLANNKIKILSWAAVMVVISLIGTFVVKR